MKIGILSKQEHRFTGKLKTFFENNGHMGIAIAGSDHITGHDPQSGDEFWKIVARVAAQSSDELFWKGVALLAKTRGADIVGQFRKPSDSSRLRAPNESSQLPCKSNEYPSNWRTSSVARSRPTISATSRA